MKDEFEKLVEVFKEETSELLSELETSLLELEKSPRNEDAISAIFRAFHSIKGSGGMFGFDNISSFTHEIETVYDLVRSGKIHPGQAAYRSYPRFMRYDPGDDRIAGGSA